MYRRIVVPLDGSLAAEQAVTMAAALAQRSGAELQLALVHVPLTSLLAVAPVAIDTGDLDAIQWEDEEVYLRTLADRLRCESGLTVSAHHLTGAVTATLAAHIADASADLVVMTTHGRGPVGKLWLGSIAEGLLRTAEVPMLLLRAADRAIDARLGFRRVLVPLDQSELAEHALSAARQLIGEDGECILLHVVHPGPLMGVMPVPFGIIPDLAADTATREHARSYLERMARRLRRAGVRARTAVTVAGNAAIEILDEAERERADAIVVTTHGAGGVRRLLLGSVVDKLIRGADVPVLVCRPPARTVVPPAPRALAVHRGH